MDKGYDGNDIAILYMMIFVLLVLVREFLSAELRVRDPTMANVMGIAEDIPETQEQWANTEGTSLGGNQVKNTAGLLFSGNPDPALLDDVSLHYFDSAARTR